MAVQCQPTCTDAPTPRSMAAKQAKPTCLYPMLRSMASSSASPLDSVTDAAWQHGLTGSQASSRQGRAGKQVADKTGISTWHQHAYQHACNRPSQAALKAAGAVQWHRHAAPPCAPPSVGAPYLRPLCCPALGLPHRWTSRPAKQAGDRQRLLIRSHRSQALALAGGGGRRHRQMWPTASRGGRCAVDSIPRVGCSGPSRQPACGWRLWVGQGRRRLRQAPGALAAALNRSPLSASFPPAASSGVKARAAQSPADGPEL